MLFPWRSLFASRSQRRQRATRVLRIPETLESRRTLSVTISWADVNPSGFADPLSFRSTSLGVFFNAFRADIGAELYMTDGTSAGTRLVRDIVPGPNSSSPSDFVEMNGVVYFSAISNVFGTELWRTDGTERGTYLVSDVTIGANGSGPADLTVVGDTLYFTAVGDGVGRELWALDGTDDSIRLVKDTRSGTLSGDPGYLTELGDLLLFSTSGPAGRELWRSDGTDAGTFQIADISSGTGSSSPRDLTRSGANIYFTADSSTAGRELWRTDGTPIGTVQVADINPGVPGSYPVQLTDVGGTLYFAAARADIGAELWKTTGTAASTGLVKDINPGSSGSSISNVTAVGSRIYFSATTPASGAELWTSAGTAASTLLVNDTLPGVDSGNPNQLTNLNGVLYFVAQGPGIGQELFQSRGTASTTNLVKDLNPGVSSSFINQMMAYKDTLIAATSLPLRGSEPTFFNTRPVVTIDNTNLGYSETGTWAYSIVRGVNNSTTRVSSQTTATASWSAASLTPGYYKVELFKVVQTNNAATVNALVVHSEGNKLIPINFVGGSPSGWIDLGIYRFNSGTSMSERVRLTNATTAGVLRADAVRFTPVATPITIDFGAPGYVESGTFATSTVGGNAGSTTRASNSLNASVTYSPALVAGEYLVQVYVVVNSNSTTNMGVTVSSNTGQSAFNFNPTSGASGWVTLGTYAFDGAGPEFVRLRNNNATGTLRADALRFISVSR